MRAQLCLAAILFACAGSVAGSERTVKSFDDGWRFLKADAANAEQTAFDDAAWRQLDVPHDWSIEGPFDQNNRTGGAGAFLPAGVGWYRKHFKLAADDSGKRVFVDFDGVMANSDVWVNGVHLGKRPYGYVSFEYELTKDVHFGDDDNVLAVRADNSAQPASRWYAGAGVYRHVRMVITNAVHIDHWATFVSTPRIDGQRATVQVRTSVLNQSGRPQSVALELVLLDPSGREAARASTEAQKCGPGERAEFSRNLAVSDASIWDMDHPALYKLVARVRSARRIVDDETTPFGIREFHFDPNTGFWLNGRNFKLKGVCLHGDAGALGTAVPLSAWERRLNALRKMGVNAIRTAHNPPAPEFLDLCDRMGFLVMDEMFDCWTVAKNPYDYHLYFNEWSETDTRDTVRRDRNHPSIILYSAGNEIHDTPKADLAKGILAKLVDTFHANDPTRPVTQALFRPNVSHDYDDGLADMLDVIGQNYRENEILAAHAAKPSRKIVGTENGHDRKVWLALRDNPPYSGQFIWAGIDYLGESRRWPVIANSAGLLDRTGFEKPDGLERESWWSDKPVVHMVRRTSAGYVTPTDPGYETSVAQAERRQSTWADWTPANTSPHGEDVEVYSNCRSVELLLNGKALGSQARALDDAPRVWHVPFEAGSIRAVCDGNSAAEELRTAGRAARVVLTTEESFLPFDKEHVAYLTATVVDDAGNPVPRAHDLVTFQVSGPGAIVGVDNADNASQESFQGNQRHAFDGRCIAIVKATAASGRISVSAVAEGLSGSSVTMQAR